MAILANKPPYVEITTGDLTIKSGQTWIMFTNLGSADATIDFNTHEGVTVGTATLLAGLSINFGNRVDGNDYAEFVIHAAGTTVQAIFEKANS